MGYDACQRRLAPLIAATAHQVVVDVGGGDGEDVQLVHPTATYLCLDPSRAKLLRFRSQRATGHAVRGDGAALPLRDRSVDLLICKYVFHHLSDAQLAAALGEFRRVVRGRLLVMDAIKRPGLNLGNALWMLDEGDHPRSLERNYAALDRHFDTTHEERFRILHHYFIRVCRPRA